MRVAAILTVLLLFSSPVLAKEFPRVGGYGFDWLKPKTTQCRRITPSDAEKFKTCEFSAAGYAFGLLSTYHQCVVSARSEYFIYESKAKCLEAFETMQANGP